MDNGGFSTDTAWRDPPLHTQNAPLNMEGSAYEGGIRVPMIVKWTGMVKPGQHAEVISLSRFSDDIGNGRDKKIPTLQP